MEKYAKVFRHIAFQDCDPFNQLHLPNYVDLFVRAAEEGLLSAYQVNVFEHMQQTGKGWMVDAHHMKLIDPATANEKVWIESKIIRYSSSTLLIELQMWNQQLNALKAMGWLNWKYCDLMSMKTSEHESELMELFNKVVVPVEEEMFEQHVLYIQAQLK